MIQLYLMKMILIDFKPQIQIKKVPENFVTNLIIRI